MADLKDLIERLEQLTGPLTDLGSRYDLLKVGERAGLTDDELAWLDRALAGSLDAAVAMVPEGWVFRISTDSHVSFPDANAHAECAEVPWADARVDKTGEGHAATPALALYIAALKAREPSNG